MLQRIINVHTKCIIHMSFPAMHMYYYITLHLLVSVHSTYVQVFHIEYRVVHMCSADNMSMTRLERVDQAVSHYP